MMDHYQFVARSSDHDSLKVLEPDRQHSNMLNISPFNPKTLSASSLLTPKSSFTPCLQLATSFRLNSPSHHPPLPHHLAPSKSPIRAALDRNYSSKRSSGGEQRKTIMLPGCDFNHWLIAMTAPYPPPYLFVFLLSTPLNNIINFSLPMREISGIYKVRNVTVTTSLKTTQMFVARSSYQDALKVLEPDREHSNMLLIYPMHSIRHLIPIQLTEPPAHLSLTRRRRSPQFGRPSMETTRRRGAAAASRGRRSCYRAVTSTTGSSSWNSPKTPHQPESK
ncbi:plastid developmental protein DAG [Actinidia rufa]|uniref:Plastid developmental protein DAG n=1 Tax=Actinidia rufa TaxID=165716 RepID=A0A7J0G9L7_9ERIC|nr:plastid developmental protein DAG [Actinidia rufa]